MDIISIELLSEVLGVEVVEITDIEDDIIFYTYVSKTICMGNGDDIVRDGSEHLIILAHKGKKWAFNLGFRLKISADKIMVSKKSDLEYYLHSVQNISQHESFIPYDPHIDFKACQYILENKDK